MKRKLFIYGLMTAIVTLLPVDVSAENWVRFSPEGEYAIQCSTNNRFLANTLYLGGADQSYVRLVDEFDEIACTWVLNDEREMNISVRNTQGGLNEGDYIRFDSKIRLASTVNFTDYLMNQSFQFYYDADSNTESDEIAVKVCSQGNQKGWWKSRPAGDELGYEPTHTIETATIFYLIPVKDIEVPDYGQTSLTLTGDVSDEQIYDIRDNMFKLRDLDLTATTLTSLPAHAFSGMTSLVNVYLPDGLKEIGDAAFLSCEKLTNCELPLSLTRIGAMAFARTAVKKVELGASVSEIGRGAWSGCKQLAEISVDDSNSAFIAVDAVLYNKAQTSMLICAAARNGELNLPESLIRIEDYACEGCRNLSGGLHLPNGLTYVGDFAFAGCEGLTGELKIPESLVHVGRAAFYGVSGLTGTLSIPDGETLIGNYGSYAYMEGVEHIELPSSAQALAPSVFEGCVSVVHIKSDANEPPAVGAFGLRGINRSSTYIEVSDEDSYRDADTWCEFENYSFMPRVYERFATDGDFYIATVGGYYLTYNSTGAGAMALLTGAKRASKWELAFSDVSDPAVPFGAGKATDIAYVRGGYIYHINMAGQCWQDPVEGYMRNPNRTFAVWYDPDLELWAIQSNGYVWLYENDEFIAEPYTGRQPLAEHFVWKFSSEVTEIIEIERVPDISNRSEIYDLSGRKLRKTNAPGIYIINGVKTLVK